METFSDYLESYNQEIEPVIKQKIEELTDHARRYQLVTGELISDFGELLLQGKRLRGFLVKLGYEMCGGENKEAILLASLSVEVAHTALLIHDDIIDRGSLRRGIRTIHRKYGQEYGVHSGEALAMTIGDEGLFLSTELLAECGLPSERMVRAIRYFSRRLQQVGFGQILDLTFERLGKFTEEDVLKIHAFKTAEYTISGPLGLGAILAGETEKKIEGVERYGIPIGTAFQLRDDELGVFSSSRLTAKTDDSDLVQGKATLLIAKALELAKGEDQRFLKRVWSSVGMRAASLERIKRIIVESGALEYSGKLSRKLVEEGKKYIPEITKDPTYQNYLTQLADFVIERES